MARIEKILQGGITHCAEPYMKSSDSTKVLCLSKCVSKYVYTGIKVQFSCRLLLVANYFIQIIIVLTAVENKNLLLA